MLEAKVGGTVTSTCQSARFVTQMWFRSPKKCPSFLHCAGLIKSPATERVWIRLGIIQAAVRFSYICWKARVAGLGFVAL